MKHMFVVGKYTLESLTNGMYSSPLDLYREYIQNAVDSIDDAVRSGIVDKKNSRIDISVNTETATISIKDNGCGIGRENAERLLVDIGNSKKSRSLSRGFRGIGRLAGLGYCDSLSFITTFLFVFDTSFNNSCILYKWELSTLNIILPSDLFNVSFIK